MLVDFTKAGSGGGARGNLVINVNGNNETAMLAQIESYMRSIGFISFRVNYGKNNKTYFTPRRT